MGFENWIEQQKSTAARVEPKTIPELFGLLEAAAKGGQKIRAAGSGHSTSEVVRPVDGGQWVHLEALDPQAAANLPAWPYLREGCEQPGSYLERVGAATTIKTLHARLAKANRALVTVGSYDAQTIAGAVLTGTHGSGIRHQCLADYVAAIEIVTVLEEGGLPVAKLLRIEPGAGITDRAAFEAARQGTLDPVLSRTELRQGDDLFRAAVVSFGTMGIVTSLTLRVTDRYWLWEDERLAFWSHLSQEIVDPATGERIKRIAWYMKSWPEHVDITVAAHEMPASHVLAGEVVCVVRFRNKIPARDPATAPKRKDVTPAPPWLAGVFGTGIVEWYTLNNRDAFLRSMYQSFDGRAGLDPQESDSSIIMRTSYGDHVRATSSELSFPMESAPGEVPGTRLVGAVNELLRLAKVKETPDVHGDLEWFHTSPIGIRFVASSRSLLAHTAGPPGTYHATIEIPLLASTRASAASRARHEQYRQNMLSGLEAVLTDPDGPHRGRPHWGQRFYHLDGPRAQRMYEGWHTFWLAQRELNRYGVFDNDVTALLSL